MTVPSTLKEEKFLALPKEKFSKILQDNYIHVKNNILTTKFLLKSLKDCTFNYK